MYVSLERADRSVFGADDELVVHDADLFRALGEVADARPRALVRHFAGQQHDAVVARDVEVDAVAVLVVGLVGDLELDAFVVDLRAGRPAVGGDQRRAAAAPATTTGTQPESAATATASASETRPARRGSSPRPRAAWRRWRRTGNGSSASGPPGCVRCADAAHTDGRRRAPEVHSMRPPPLPVSATTRISRVCAASMAAITLPELPDVEIASSTSPLVPSARTCFANTCSNE